jgi:hypothetical protein
MGRLWNDADNGKPKYAERNLSHHHIFYHKSHMFWPGIEPGPSWLEAGD